VTNLLGQILVEIHSEVIWSECEFEQNDHV